MKKPSDFTSRIKETLDKNGSKIALAGIALAAALWIGLGKPSKSPDAGPARDAVAALVESEKDTYVKEEKSFSSLLKELQADEVSVLAIASDGELLVRNRDNERYYVHSPAPSGVLTEALNNAKDNNIEVVTLRERAFDAPLNIAETLGNVSRVALNLLLIGLVFFMVRSSTGMLGGAKTYTVVKDPGVRFDDIIGCEDAKESLQEVVAYLKNPEQFAKVGARAPKGVLTVGPPGTGKTMMAKALAGECGVPFISLNGSSFTSSFVGMGVSKVKALFRDAAKMAPCVIFIDEMDGIGRRESSGQNGAVETENRRIINAILTELDGFDTKKGIVVVGATNFIKQLDEGLTREGRFDRQCVLTLPTVAEREALFKMYAKSIITADDLDFARVSRLSAGLAPSAIAAVMNQAAIKVALSGRLAVEQADVQNALERLQLGAPTPSVHKAMTPAIRQRVAVHEAGHAIIGWALNVGRVDGVTIIPREKALGVTLLTPEFEEILHTEEDLSNKIMVLLAGRAAEKTVLGNFSNGASNDLERASAIALTMVGEVGMAGQAPFNYKALGSNAETFARSKTVEDASVLLTQLEAKTMDLMATYRVQLDRLTAALLEHETLTGAEALALIELSEVGHSVQADVLT